MPCQVEEPPPETVRLLGLIAQANGEETVATGEACSILFRILLRVRVCLGYV